ncbi:uncharacterized protein [Antedon mediterranea]|uniref:uncharacterized protein n=1 Tax=Antedon mediterranea TaxID=105859 RepID=UPI003AF53ED4
MVGGIEVDGPGSVLGSTNTICSEHLEEPEIEFKTVGDNQMTVRLKPVSSDYDSIQCNSILRYQVQYSDFNGHTQYVVNTTNSSQLEVELSGLSSCTNYIVNARVVNNVEIAGSWGQEITVQTAPSEPSIESNPFTNGTHWLMKWKASWCDIPDYHVTYHYELSGGLFQQQGTTIQTEVVFVEGIESCKEYTFTVLASYLNVNGTSDTKTTMFGIDCDQKKQVYGYVIGVVVTSIIATVAITLMIFIRFRRIHSEKDVGKSSTTQQDICTIDTDYQSLSKKYKESEYEGIKPTVATTEHVYTNPQQSVPEHVYGNTITN